MEQAGRFALRALFFYDGGESGLVGRGVPSCGSLLGDGGVAGVPIAGNGQGVSVAGLAHARNLSIGYGGKPF